jgi:hypothetical protein
MNTAKWISVAMLGFLLAVPAMAAGAGVKRPRPPEVPGAETSMAPNDFQVYNDYASPERTYSSHRAVIHYVVRGIDAPPLNDDAADGVPDYVEYVADAADLALAYFEHRGFLSPLPDAAGPDGRPDIYVSRFSPGTIGIAFPASRAEGGAFAVVANNLDPSAERSFASIYATVAHELFHLVQFSYFRPTIDPVIPSWIMEGTAAAMEGRVNPQLEDLVSAIQLRPWFSAMERGMTTQSYGAQLLWRWLDTQTQGFLPALFARLAAHPVAGDGRRAVASTYAAVAGKPFADAFHRFAVSVVLEHAEDVHLRPLRSTTIVPLAVRYIRVALPRTGDSRLALSFPRGRAGASVTLVYRIDGDVAGASARTRQLTPHVSHGGRRLMFNVSAGPRRSAVLVLSNGGARTVRYTISTR